MRISLIYAIYTIFKIFNLQIFFHFIDFVGKALYYIFKFRYFYKDEIPWQ